MKQENDEMDDLTGEALQTVFMIGDFFDRHALEHPAIKRDPELAKMAAEISERLGVGSYQGVGAIDLSSPSR